MAKRSNKENSNSKTYNKKPYHRGKDYSKDKLQKKFEVNVPDNAVNKSDLLHVLIKDNNTSNDVSWYKNLPQLVADTANVPFNDALGMQLYTGFAESVNINESATTVPGIMVFTIYPTPGISDDPTSAINVAAQQLYTMDRKANSGATNYDKTDLMMTVYGMDNAYMLLEDLIRAYKTIREYNYLNKYYPIDLLNAEGYGVQLFDEIANFRALINNFIYKLASINVPDQFDFIKRHAWMFSNVYKDSDSDKAQTYLYKLGGLHVWTEGQSGVPTYLKFYTRNELFGLSSEQTTVTTLAQIQHAINTVMEPLLGSQDVGTISGDLARAFGEGGMIKLSTISEDEQLDVSYNMEVIQQMMNCTVKVPNKASMDISAVLDDLVSGPYLVFTPTCILTNARLTELQHNYLLNLRSQNPSTDDVLVATRLMSTYGSAESSGHFYLRSCGTEIVTNIAVYQRIYTPGGIPGAMSTNVNTEFLFSHASGGTDITQSSILSYIGQTIAMAPFDNCPTVYVMEAGGNYFGAIQDYDTYTYVTPDVIDKINYTAVLSLFKAKGYNN